VKKMEEDDVHVGLTITPTTLTACPRSTLISRLLPYYALPVHFDSPSLGTALHGDAEQGARELGYEAEVLIEADIPGIGLMKGRPDMICVEPAGYTGTSIIQDTKLTNQGSLATVRNKKDGLAKPDHCAQLSFYRIMIHKTRGILLQDGIVNYVCPLSGPERAKQGGTNWVRRPVKWMDLDELLAFKPFDGLTTIGEHAAILNEAKVQLAAGKSPEEVIAALPLYGYTYIGGNGRWCQEYCEANFECSRLGGGEGVLANWQRNLHFADPEETA